MSNTNETIANDFAKKMDTFMAEFMNEFMRRVAARTPVKTGAAQQGYYIEKDNDVYYLKNTQDYIVYLELGTEYIKPHAMIQTTMLEADDIIAIAKQKAGIE
jgi:hypothetical protein